jgi:hypothetical protein
MPSEQRADVEVEPLCVVAGFPECVADVGDRLGCLVPGEEVEDQRQVSHRVTR